MEVVIAAYVIEYHGVGSRQDRQKVYEQLSSSLSEPIAPRILGGANKLSVVRFGYLSCRCTLRYPLYVLMFVDASALLGGE